MPTTTTPKCAWCDKNDNVPATRKVTGRFRLTTGKKTFHLCDEHAQEAEDRVMFVVSSNEAV